MRTVLIAEPHPQTRQFLHQLVAQAGYRVLACEDASRALELCISERPSAVLVGVDLPRYQGVTLGKLLRGTDLGASLPLLAVDKGHLGRAKGVGGVLDLMVNGYVADATKGGELLDRLAGLINAAAQAPKPTTGIAATLARPPVVTAELRSRTLPANVHSWFRLERTGVLVLVHRELTRRIFIVRGAPVNYDSSARQDGLPAFLLERGTIASQAHGELVTMMGRDQLSAGAALVALGVVEAGEPLLALLKEYARTKISEAYAMSGGRFSFHAGEEFIREVPALELPALGPLYAAVRAAWPVRAFASELGPRMKKYPVRTPEFAKTLPALGLSTADLKLALSVNGRQSLRDLLATGRDLKHGLALFWYLALVGVLRFEETVVEGGSSGFEVAERAAATARRRKPLPEEKAHELREEAIRILTASYFRALGLDVTADGESVERAFHEAATRFHPDSYPENDLGQMEDLLASVQDKLSAAYRVLSEEEKRKAYVAYLLSRSDVARMSTPNVEAEIQLKRGEKLMRKGDLRGALGAFERAVSLNAREPEYYSYLAWATFRAGEGDGPHRARAASKLIKKALSINPTLERPQIIGAIIEDEAGDPAEARRMLLRLLKASPGCELAKKTLQSLSRKRGAGEKASSRPMGAGRERAPADRNVDRATDFDVDLDVEEP